jgi:ankyrin repeat protein
MDEELENACIDGDLEEVKRLLDDGVDVNSKNNVGSTPLYLACTFRHANVVKILIDRGANVNINTKNGRTPFQQACENNDATVVKLLIDGGADEVAKNNCFTYVTSLAENLNNESRYSSLIALTQPKGGKSYKKTRRIRRKTKRSRKAVYRRKDVK